MSDRRMGSVYLKVWESLVENVDDEEAIVATARDVLKQFLMEYDIDVADLCGIDDRLDRVVETIFDQDPQKGDMDAEFFEWLDRVLSEARSVDIRSLAFNLYERENVYVIILIGSPITPEIDPEEWRIEDTYASGLYVLPDRYQLLEKNKIEAVVADEIVAYVRAGRSGAKRLKTEKYVCTGFENENTIFLQDRIRAIN